MTLESEVFAAMQEARDAAADTYSAVQIKALQIASSPILWGQKTQAEGMLSNAALNLATIELLPEILEDALAEQDQATALAQAVVVIEQTGEATVRYAEWADSSSLAALARETWAVLVELVAELAYVVADAVIVVGKRATEGLGFGGVVAVLAALGVVGFVTTR
jgi:hypothetical protein